MAATPNADMQWASALAFKHMQQRKFHHYRKYSTFQSTFVAAFVALGSINIVSAPV